MIRGKHWEDGWLTVYWGREARGCSPDIIYGSPSRPDGHLLRTFFSHTMVDGKSLIDNLKERGYDIETLQFSIRRGDEKRKAVEEARIAYEKQLAEIREANDRETYERLKAKYEGVV